MVSVERTVTVLQRGSNALRREWRDSGWREERIEKVMLAVDQVDWCHTADGVTLTRLSPDTPPGEFRVAVHDGRPSKMTSLNSDVLAQTYRHVGDHLPTVFVRRASLTPLWAGFALIHELEHALDYKASAPQEEESPEEWDSAGGRVHGHQAIILDAITSGQASASISGRTVEDVLEESPHALASQLMATIPARLRRQPPTKDEDGLRIAGLAMSALIFSALAPKGILAGVDSVDLGPIYRQGCQKFGNS